MEDGSERREVMGIRSVLLATGGAKFKVPGELERCEEGFNKSSDVANVNVAG